MAAQRHTQARAYAAAPALLARVRQLRAAAAGAASLKAAADARLFFRRAPGAPHAALREDAEAAAVAACAGLGELLLAPEQGGEGPLPAAWRKMETRRLAAALTAVDAGLLAGLSGRELLRGARAGPAAVPKSDTAGRRVVRLHPIVAATAHWNRLSRWVPSAVLFPEKALASEAEAARARAKTLRKFVELAAELRELHNWSSLFAIVIGLGSSTVSCLKETWKLVPARHTALFRELEEACQPVSNFRVYRESLAGLFCVPYLAIVLKDLQAVEEGNPDRNARGLFNFEKMQLAHAVLIKVRALQAVPCPVKNVDRRHLQFVIGLSCKSENELWDQSRIVKDAEVAMAAMPPKRFGTFRH